MVFMAFLQGSQATQLSPVVDEQDDCAFPRTRLSFAGQILANHPRPLVGAINPWGFRLAGAEWIEDCWNGTLVGMSSDGRARVPVIARNMLCEAATTIVRQACALPIAGLRFPARKASAFA
jgi:hypothetical protein